MHATKTSTESASVNHIYTLDGKVPLLNAIPFGLQHILAMFVSNIAPILIVGGACGLDSKETALLIQSAMLIAGIGTLVRHGHQLYLCVDSQFCRCAVRVRRDYGRSAHRWHD